MFLCTGSSVVNHNRHEGEISPMRCKRWSCPTCKEYNRKRVMHAAKRGRPNAMLTLTVSSTQYPDADEAARRLKTGWIALRRRIERNEGQEKTPFIVVFEKHKSGHPHMHLLIRSKFISWDKLRTWWEEITGSTHVHIRKIRKPSQALFYVCKYIGKDLEAFTGCKRWWRSHNYNVVTEDPYEPNVLGVRIERWDIPFDQLTTALKAIGVPVEREGRAKVRWRSETPFSLSRAALAPVVASFDWWSGPLMDDEQ